MIDGVGRLSGIARIADVFHRSSSVVLPPGRPVELLARLGGFGPLGEKAALFIAADTFVRPKSLEDEFCSRGGNCRISFAVGAEALEMIEEAVHAAQRGELAQRQAHFQAL